MGKRGPKKKQKEGAPKDAAIEQMGTATEDVEETITLPEAAEGKSITFVEPENPIAPESTPDVSRQEAPAEVETLSCDTWLYHNDEQPKIFKADSEIPAGWHRNQKPLDFFWSCDGYGKWDRKEK